MDSTDTQQSDFAEFAEHDADEVDENGEQQQAPAIKSADNAEQSEEEEKDKGLESLHDSDDEPVGENNDGNEGKPTASENKNPQVKLSKNEVAKRKGRGITGYMHFLKQNRLAIKEELGEGKAGLKEVACLAAEKWRALTDEERAKWNEEAKSIVPAAKPELDSNEIDEEEKGAVPISRIREIVKKDPEVKNIQALAVRVLALATEKFAAELSKQALECGDRKRIRQIDVHHIVHSNEDQFGFLAYDFETPAQVVSREEKETRLKKAKLESVTTSSSASNVIAAQGRSSIASYFQKNV